MLHAKKKRKEIHKGMMKYAVFQKERKKNNKNNSFLFKASRFHIKYEKHFTRLTVAVAPTTTTSSSSSSSSSSSRHSSSSKHL